MIGFILVSIFFGFAVFVLLSDLLPLSKKDKVQTHIQQWKEAAIALIRLSGIAFLILWATLICSSGDQYVLANRMFGPYAFSYWIYPITFSLVSQLFWIKKIKYQSWARVLYAVLILVVLYFEKMVILLTSLNRDYVPSSWSMLYQWPNELVQLGIFAVFLVVAYFIKQKIKKLI